MKISNATPAAPSTASLLLTRRLESGDGGFDGIVMFAADPAYLAHFSNETELGAKDFLALLDSSGLPLVTRLGESPRPVASLFRLTNPVKTDTGLVLAAPQEFSDDAARIVAWQRLPESGLIVAAGIAEQEDDVGIGKAEARTRRRAMIAHTRVELARVDGVVDDVQLLFR